MRMKNEVHSRGARNAHTKLMTHTKLMMDYFILCPKIIA
jgi:hypothetical protein